MTSPRVGTDRGTPLRRDISFWGMSITQFLGAFNDNLYKQLMLLLAIPVGVASLGIVQLQVSTLLTSIMNGGVGLGIAAGAIIGGRLCHSAGDRKVIRFGLWGIVICLTLLSISWPIGKTVEIPVEPTQSIRGAAARVSLKSIGVAG